MPSSQFKLAAKYHTTAKPDNSLCLEGMHHVVGLDIDEGEMPNGRYIWFSLDNPKNGGSVLRGETVCDYRVSTLEEVRKHAIARATYRLGDAKRAANEVDRVIKSGGMLLEHGNVD